MSFINLANQSFNRSSKATSVKETMSIELIDNKILECKQAITNIKKRVDEAYNTWKALREDYLMMSFAKVFDTTVKESMQDAIDKLKLEYEDAKNTLDFYKQLKNKTLLEAEVTLSKDDMFNPNSISLSGLAKKSYDKEQEEKALAELEAKREKAKQISSQVIEDVEDSLSRGDRPSDTLEIIFNAFVPNSGKADTLAGELARAMMKILYRDWNDGDLFYTGYGIESSCGSAAAYLMDKEWYDDFNSIREQQLENEDYTDALESITKNIIEYILDNPELLIEPNTEDYLNSSTDELEENQPRYDLEVYFSDDLRELSDEDWFDIYDAVGYLENHLSWESDWRDAEVEVWSIYDDYLTVTGLTRDGLDRLLDSTHNTDSFWEELVNQLKEEHTEEDSDSDDVDESLKFTHAIREMLNNKSQNTNRLNELYSVLEKYGSDDDDLLHIYRKASKEDKQKLLNIIK